MSMYNKLFTKILDSSVWLEPSPTRIVWLTLIAAMDEDGFVQFASVANLAHRARVSPAEAQKAVAVLEGPDENSSDPEHDGRRIERVAGGWMILNAAKYRELVTRTISRERTRLRVARHREKKAGGNGDVTLTNASVTQSEAVSVSESKVQSEEGGERASGTSPRQSDADEYEKMPALNAHNQTEIPSDFAKMVHADWASREGKDAAGVKVQFNRYVLKRWQKEGAQWKAGCHKGNGKVEQPIRGRV